MLSIMIKTQIQLPDQMYHALKRLAQRQEWSLAEAIRRGSELLLVRYPTSTQEKWTLPQPRSLGWKNLSHSEIKNEILKDQEGRL